MSIKVGESAVRQINPNLRDGFEVLQPQFALSIPQIEELDSQGISEAVICDLFVNFKLKISDVANLANANRETVIQTLLKQGMVKDRRHEGRQRSSAIERRNTEN